MVGAGPAGATVARLLALKGREVILADPGAATATRLELLAPASLATVAAVGLEPLLNDPAVARRCCGIRRTRGSGETDYVDFLRHPYRLGYVVDRARFDGRLRAAAIDAGVTFRRLRATGVAPDGGIIFRESVSGVTTLIRADVVVDATGRAAAIGRRRGARVIARDRRVAELVENIDSSPNAGASWLDYRSDGSSWSYRIHGPGGRAQTWRIRPSRTRAGTVLRTVDASASLLSEAAGEGWIAVGDAAIAFDPIASQGLFNALSSALVATGTLLSADQLSPTAAKSYSDAATATFLLSEAGRDKVYGNRAWPGRFLQNRPDF
ncbi:FAD-dependent monooxygenase [Methylocystis sp. H62]|uniref:NAD(P)/FAD-dependent oxidoreductase n=1 Tax=Methylocystis sp. H62 TaxID=2785789 RepID=UPI0028A0CCCF|nr:FAD-dependent monooxygenase [Methylocystis sp. H62]